MKHARFLSPLLLVVLAQAAFGQAKKDDKEPEVVSYYKDIRPIFQQHCQGCHQPAKAQGGFVMTSYAELFKNTDHEVPGVLAKQPDKSEIVKQITKQAGKPPAMPRGKEPLSDREVRLITKWIAQGASDDTPASARTALVDQDHPPVYDAAPVITGLAYSPDGKILAVTGYHEVLLWSDDGRNLLARLVGLSERAQSLAFSPKGDYLAVTAGDPGRVGELQIWDVAKKKLKISIPITYDTIYGASWSPDGTRVAFGCADNSLRAVEAETGKQVLFQGAHNDWVLDTVWSKDGAHLISVSRDRSMKLTEVATQRLEDNITSITPGALKGGLQALDRDPRSNNLLIGGADGVPKLYQMFRTKPRMIGDDFNFIRKYPALEGRIFTVRFNKEGTRFVAGSSSDGKGEALVAQTDDAKLVSKLEGQRGPVYAAAYHPNGSLVATAGFDGMVRLNDPNNGKLIREFVPVPVRTKTAAK
ncbi:MAG: c-type cytochrome domain-containing protein [Gemmataceae bacterium]